MPTSMTARSEFGARLRRCREAAALTQEELADRAGLTVKAVGALERGERRWPHPHTVRSLADALQLDDTERALLVQAAHRSTTPGDSPPAAGAPAPATAMLGRQEELNEVIDLLRSGRTRLLTITGPGGVGKTRLALAAGAELAEDFAGSVTVIELAPVLDPALVLPTIGRSLGLAQVGRSDPLEAVVRLVADRRQLVVLDNLEHLLTAAPALATLLARCPGLVVLATSRALLRIAAEQDFPLAPLSVPAGPDLAAVAASPAAQVFLTRALAVAPRLRLDKDTAPAIAAICQRLDGLPLALELAAAHAQLLPPAALRDRLTSSLGLARRRDLPERQRTMAATLDWSHDLLTRDEQRLLRRLSVFAGGFTLDAAEQISGEDVDVLSALAGLVEQSLVLPEQAPEARYRMLEPVRQYAAGRLRDAGEAEPVRDRHADHVCDLAAAARMELRGGEQAAWVRRLEREQDNLRTAMATLRERADLDRLARLGGDVWLYWALRGYVTEGLRSMEQVVSDPRSGDLAAPARAAVQVALAGLRYAGGDIAGTRSAATAAVDAARSAGDLEPVLTDALMLSGAAAVFAGDLDAADEPLAEAGRRAEERGDAFALAQVRFAQAQLAFRAGSVPASAAYLAEAEEIAREVGLPFTLAVVLNMQAVVAEVTGADDLALDQLTEAAEVAADVGTTWALVYTLPALAVLAARRSLPELAATLFAAGEATAEASSLPVSFPPSREGAEHWLVVVRDQLTPAAWRRAQESGRLLSPDEVADLARTIRASVPA